MNQLLSVVIPSFNEEGMIPRTAKTIAKLLQERRFLTSFCSSTTAHRYHWEKIQTEAAANPRVKGINFSRNFGKESAIYAGLFYSAGGCCVVIDCDLQHPPEKIIEMYRLWEEGYEIVEGVKHSRGQTERYTHFSLPNVFTRSSAV